MKALKKILFLSLAGLSVLMYQNCTPFEQVELSSSSLEFSFFKGLNDKVFGPKCLECHSGVSAAGGADFSSYSSIIASGTVSVGNASSSSIYTAVVSPLAEGHPVLSAPELEGLASWINNGARENEPPVANAGEDISVLLPATTSRIEGRARDLDGQIVSYLWNQTQGPNTATLTNANSSMVNLSNLVEGNYTFNLTVTDDSGATGSDTVNVSVSLSPNILPVVNAGADRNVVLPTSTVSITATASDSDGTISLISWTQTSGPNTATLSGQSTLSLTASSLVAGTYVFNIEVTDNRGGTRSDSVNVVVSAEPVNLLPVVNAGADRSITLPTSSSTILASASDPDGTIAAFLWTQISGPSTATLSGATTAVLTASNLIQGTYVFNIRVTDNRGGVANDMVSVLVNPVPPAPTFTQVNNLIFAPLCSGCHGNAGGYNMGNYSNVMDGVVVNNANASLLYQRVIDNSMPPGSPLDTIDKNMIRDWINNGAQNN